jgi:hypothetical protein
MDFLPPDDIDDIEYTDEDVNTDALLFRDIEDININLIKRNIPLLSSDNKSKSNEFDSLVWNYIENHFEISRIVKFSHDSINISNAESNLLNDIEYIILDNNTKFPNKVLVSSIIGIETMIKPINSNSITSKDNSLTQLKKDLLRDKLLINGNH